MKKKFKSFIKSENILKRYKDKNGYYITFGTIDGGRWAIEVSISKRMANRLNVSDYNVLYTPIFPDLDNYSWYLSDFSEILGNCGILSKTKSARRWFIRESKNLSFGKYRLSDFLIPGTIKVDWNKVENEFKNRIINDDNI